MLRKLEKRLRNYRDHKIIPSVLNSRFLRKHLPIPGDAAVFDCGDHWMAADPYDGMSKWLQEKRGWFRSETMQIFSALPQTGGAFIDVGANIGTQTIYALKFGGFERAVCFEPDPRNLRILRMNIGINGLSDRVSIIEAGAGSATGTASLSLSYRNGGTNSIAEKRGEETITVPVVRVEDELHRLGVEDIGLAWIDVEGYEGEVLKGWPSAVGKPLCIEYSPEVKPLPVDTFSGWGQWANVKDMRWRPIGELDLTAFSTQQDLLFA